MTAPAAPAGDGAHATTFGDPAAIDRAHQAVRGDPSIQFDLPWHTPDVRPPPSWLRGLFQALGDFVEWVGGGWTVIMWLAIAAAVLAALFVLYRPAREWLAARTGHAAGRPDTLHWAPRAAAARALLDEADRLAAQGRYAQAVRLILHRSIEDIEAWRGDPLRPSLTSRDIARFEGLPDAARTIFARIVADVERSLFGGAALARADWTRARADYAAFALGRAAA